MIQEITLLLLFTRRDHFIIGYLRHKYMVFFFPHIPFVVNRAFSATPAERLQQYKEALPANIGIRYSCPMVGWSPQKQTAQKMSKTYTVFRLKEIESIHGHWFISLRARPCIFGHSVLHVIKITWFTHVFANVRRVTKWVQFAGCSVDLVI